MFFGARGFKIKNIATESTSELSVSEGWENLKIHERYINKIVQAQNTHSLSAYGNYDELMNTNIMN